MKFRSCFFIILVSAIITGAGIFYSYAETKGQSPSGTDPDGLCLEGEGTVPEIVDLKKQGIEAYYDNLFVVTHSKAIVIDEEVVILGSANWTESSLKRNWEASCLIRSKELAKQLLKDFPELKLLIASSTRLLGEVKGVENK